MDEIDGIAGRESEPGNVGGALEEPDGVDVAVPDAGVDETGQMVVEIATVLVKTKLEV